LGSALASGKLQLDPAVEADQLAKDTANAKFLHDSGQVNLKILDQLKPYPLRVRSPVSMKSSALPPWRSP